MMIIRFLLFFVLMTSLLGAKDIVPGTPSVPAYIVERDRGSTSGLMENRKAITSNIEVVFTEPDLKKCKRVGSVRTSKPVEMWQKGEACIIRHMELKRQSVLMKGNVVYVDPIQECDANVFTGQSYCCLERCELVQFR